MDEATSNIEPFPKPPVEPTPERGLRWVFIGPNGVIRAGWGILLFIVLVFAAGFSISFLVRHLTHPPQGHNPMMSPRMGAIFEGLQLLSIAIATGVMAWVERRSILSYGFQGAARGVRFFWGLIWGFVAISALVLTLWQTGHLAFDGQLLHGGAIAKRAAEWGLVFLLVGVSEESLTRGYLQFTLTRGIGFWWGALLMSFLFGFGHHSNPGESPVGLVSAGAVGLVFCLSLWYTGSLWWAVGFHAAWDWGQSYFYGTPDSGLMARGHLFSEHPVGNLLWSGGSTGPEGSVLILPLLVIMALAMWLWWGRRVQSPFAGSGWRPAWIRRPARADVSGIGIDSAGMDNTGIAT